LFQNFFNFAFKTTINQKKTSKKFQNNFFILPSAETAFLIAFGNSPFLVPPAAE
jgi:hypothetical protein